MGRHKKISAEEVDHRRTTAYTKSNMKRKSKKLDAKELFGNSIMSSEILRENKRTFK